MNKTRKRSFTALLISLVTALVLVLSLGIFCACGESTDGKADATGAWYYGAAAPADELGQEGDFYLNTQTLSSYKKTANGWTMALEADEVGDWLYGAGAPGEIESKVGDFYLDTKSGNLYHKGESGWGEPVLQLFGTNGRDGVMWFSGEKADPSTYGEDDTTVKDAIPGDFYLDTLNFEVWQKAADGTWTDLGSLKGKDGEAGVSPKLEGFLTGKGAPTPDLGAEKDFYLDTETGEIWQKGSVSWSKKGSLGNLSASHIKEVKYLTRSWGLTQGFNVLNSADSMGGTLNYNENLKVGGSSIEGYWLIFENNSAFFIQKKCFHDSGTGQNSIITIYNDDCTFGTVQILKCAYCGETVTRVKDPTSKPTHRYAEGWTSDETHHWHEAVCSHKAELDPKKDEHLWREYYTVDYDEGSSEVKGYIKWQECKICGFTTNDKISAITPESLLQGEIVHISNADEWNVFAKAVNSGAEYSDGAKKFAEATVELDGDINFGGLTITPIGLPSNAADVTDRTNGAYLDLKADAEIQGGFKGTFKGNGHTLSKFVLDGGNFTGLFGYLDNAKIENLTVKNATVTGDAFVGGVAGFITGTDLRISKVTVIDSKVTGLAHIGGIAGYAKDAGPKLTKANASDEAAIKNCTVMSETGKSFTNDAVMQIKAVCYDTKDTDGYYFDGANVGGILGTSYSSSVIGCYVKEIKISYVTSFAGFVGFAEGTNEAKSVVLGNILSVESGQNNITSLNGVTKNGQSMDKDRRTPKSKVGKLEMKPEGGDFYVRMTTNGGANVLRSNNKESTTEMPYEGAGE